MGFCLKKRSTHITRKSANKTRTFTLHFFLLPALPPSRFGEPPLPALPLPLNSGDEELFSPGINDLSPNCCGDVSPTFEKPNYREMEKTMEASRFVAQHVKNKDKFESVSTNKKYGA